MKIEELRSLPSFRELIGRENQIGESQLLHMASRIPDEGTVLIFGVGNDSEFWLDANPYGQTFFIEDNPKWISKTVERLEDHHSTFSIYKWEYATKLRVWTETLPPLIHPIFLDPDRVWSTIIVDAPNGDKDGSPGRQESIHIASRIRSQGTDVFVHDYQRAWEKKCSHHYLGTPHEVLSEPDMRCGKLGCWHREV